MFSKSLFNPRNGTNSIGSFECECDNVTMPAVSTLMVRFIVIVILDILVMGSIAKNLTKEPNSTRSAVCGHVPKVSVKQNSNVKMSTNVLTCQQNGIKCQNAQTQWAHIDAHVSLDTVATVTIVPMLTNVLPPHVTVLQVV